MENVGSVRKRPPKTRNQLNQLTSLANKKRQHLHWKCSESKYWQQQQQQQLQRVFDQQHLSTLGKSCRSCKSHESCEMFAQAYIELCPFVSAQQVGLPQTQTSKDSDSVES
ncbi:hypothetical protein ACLKA7_000303 [Drosophila subpalustris]